MAQVTYTIEDGTCFADFDNRKKTVWKERWVNPSEFPSGPVKGDILLLNLDGTDREYRVLKIEDNVAEVFTMFNIGEKTKWGSIQNYTHANCTLRQVMEAWYASLSEDAKAAIISKVFKQDMWRSDGNGSPVYVGKRGTTSPGTTSYTISFDRRYGNDITASVYPLSVQDVLDYVLDTNITDGELQNYNIWKMFWNDEVSHSGEDIWLISASNASSSKEFSIYSLYGYFVASDGTMSEDLYKNYPRAAFKIDLSKINYQIKE